MFVRGLHHHSYIFQIFTKKKCGTVYDDKCKSIPEESCTTVYKNKCRYDKKCSTSYVKECTKVRFGADEGQTCPKSFLIIPSLFLIPINLSTKERLNH